MVRWNEISEMASASLRPTRRRSRQNSAMLVVLGVTLFVSVNVLWDGQEAGGVTVTTLLPRARRTTLANEEAAGSGSGSGNNQCVWEPLGMTYEATDDGEVNECADLLSRTVGPSANHQWALFGDSTMKKLSVELQKGLEGLQGRHWPALGRDCVCSVKALPIKGCRYAEVAYSFKPEETVSNEQWIPPAPEDGRGEGPVRFGLEHPQCHDCNSCHPFITECDHVNQPKSCSYRTTMSYHGVGFARDRELQTSTTTTTQETLALYMDRQRTDMKSPPFLCVANAGLHDFLIPGMNTETYAANVRTWMKLLRPQCSHLIWLSINAALDEVAYLQQNDVIREWNDAVRDILSEEAFKTWAVYVDVYTATDDWPHVDNVHLDEAYYAELASTLLTVTHVVTEEGSERTTKSGVSLKKYTTPSRL